MLLRSRRDFIASINLRGARSRPPRTSSGYRDSLFRASLRSKLKRLAPFLGRRLVASFPRSPISSLDYSKRAKNSLIHTYMYVSEAEVASLLCPSGQDGAFPSELAGGRPPSNASCNTSLATARPRCYVAILSENSGSPLPTITPNLFPSAPLLSISLFLPSFHFYSKGPQRISGSFDVANMYRRRPVTDKDADKGRIPLARAATPRPPRAPPANRVPSRRYLVASSPSQAGTFAGRGVLRSGTRRGGRGSGEGTLFEIQGMSSLFLSRYSGTARRPSHPPPTVTR
ncbi:hypothetical protein EVAR_82889_1 [Eumeta japonica]|uniref:Uncharacterized protein n=1 Tax=Eumeta variegata TaxID=151549 RepID=A0A4C1YKP8_EUMVA|nr:hypothetical protein EVAR_82889_1 [Eumeta japonica]